MGEVLHENLRDTHYIVAHCCSQSLNHSAMTHPSKKGLAPAERYHTLAKTASRFWEGVILHWAGNRENTNYEQIASWGGCQYWTGNPRILETPLAAHCCSQRLNHSAMIHPSKTDWQPSGVTHWLQLRVDSGQEPFSTGLLTPDMYEGNMRTCLRALAAG